MNKEKRIMEYALSELRRYHEQLKAAVADTHVELFMKSSSIVREMEGTIKQIEEMCPPENFMDSDEAKKAYIEHLKLTNERIKSGDIKVKDQTIAADWEWLSKRMKKSKGKGKKGV